MLPYLKYFLPSGRMFFLGKTTDQHCNQPCFPARDSVFLVNLQMFIEMFHRFLYRCSSDFPMDFPMDFLHFSRKMARLQDAPGPPDGWPGSFMGSPHLHASILSLDAFTGEKKWSAETVSSPEGWSWENHGKIIETHRKFTGKSWEHHGKIVTSGTPNIWTNQMRKWMGKSTVNGGLHGISGGTQPFRDFPARHLRLLEGEIGHD